MRGRICAALIGASVLALAGVAYGKADTVRIALSGPGIEGEILSSDAHATAANVWTGSFAAADRAVPEPDQALARHLVRFYIDDGQRGLRLVYAVYFVWDPQAGRALVQLPGPGDRWFRLNVGTILHDGSDGSALRDGRWYLAEQNWARAVRALLPAG